MPRVSVIIPAYNMGATIARAIDSVFAQTFTDYEIICVDDGSTDDSAAVLAKYHDRIRVVAQENLGESAARNSGARVSSGEYLAFLDADDAWRTDKLKRTVAALDEDQECVLVYSDVATSDGMEAEAQSSARVAPTRGPSLDDMLSGPWLRPIFPSTMVVRRDAFERAGGFCEELLACPDAYFALRMREVGPFSYIREPLVRYTAPDQARLLGKAVRKDAGFRYFRRLLKERYGRRVARRLRAQARWKVNLLSHAGLLALARGDRRGARRCFRMALGWNPYRVKTWLRLARTFMPLGIGVALSGRSAQACDLTAGDAQGR